MEAKQFLEQVLETYAATFDIRKPAEFGGVVYPAYGSYRASEEKYVLSRKANLWTTNSFEHVLFETSDRICAGDVERFHRVLEDCIEPELVRKGARYPEKDHMVSYLTGVFISSGKPDADAVRAVQRFRFDKGYLFSFRGHSEGHVVLVDLASKTVATNPAARHLKKFFENALRKT